MKRKPRVISIAAVSGGGKTTVTNELMGKLNNAKALYFDDYELPECPDDICEWVEKGADYNEWNLAPIIKDIQFHLNDRNERFDYILLDYPFAYLNNCMRGYIDFAVYMDTPLDIAMARRILRGDTNSFDDLRGDLNNYLSRGRAAYLEMERTVKPNSDMIIDGSLPAAFIADRITEEIRNRGL